MTKTSTDKTTTTPAKTRTRTRTRTAISPSMSASPVEEPVAAVPAAPDPWATERAAAAERIDLLTTADCMRLFTERVHPNALVLDVEAVPEVAEFRHTFGDDSMFVMGVRLKEIGASSTGLMVGTVVGSVRQGRAAVHAIHQCNWGSGDRHNMPDIMPLAEVEARFQQNPFAVSISMDGLAGVQIDRTSVTMRDVVDGFLLGHRGLSATEMERRYDHPTARRLNTALVELARHMPEIDGRNPAWSGWPDMPPFGIPERKTGLPYSKKTAREQHALGRYGNRLPLVEASEYEDRKVNEDAETRETLALLDAALDCVNLPKEAERRIVAAIETLTVKRGKVYANQGDS